MTLQCGWCLIVAADSMKVWSEHLAETNKVTETCNLLLAHSNIVEWSCTVIDRYVSRRWFSLMHVLVFGVYSQFFTWGKHATFGKIFKAILNWHILIYNVKKCGKTKDQMSMKFGMAGGANSSKMGKLCWALPCISSCVCFTLATLLAQAYSLKQ